MPRFYLHLCDGAGFFEDEEGVELPDLSTARAIAVKSLRDIVAGAIQVGELHSSSFIEIEDDERQLLMLVSFEDAIRVNGEAARQPREANSAA